ncbi:MAG: hypothetical protein J5901_05170, partial [Pseudobutyrivibrio sp.]|nr:hypothetical protein [Pseudobutyrivibrio sp.]
MIENFLIRISYFTDEGRKVYSKLEQAFDNITFEVKDDNTSLKAFAKECFEGHIPLIFIGAVGIAVRTIAPFIDNKLSDIPVLVIDERGINVIPILSGHYGMGNDLAKMIAERINANAIITTATDIENVYAIDSFAARNGFIILDKSKIKDVSMKLLEGQSVYYKNEIEDLKFQDKEPKNINQASGKKIDFVFTNDKKKDDGTLILTPKTLVIGMGCKRGKSFEELLA